MCFSHIHVSLCLSLSSVSEKSMGKYPRVRIGKKRRNVRQTSPGTSLWEDLNPKGFPAAPSAYTQGHLGPRPRGGAAPPQSGNAQASGEHRGPLVNFCFRN